jgi:uncharacterized protein YkwD
MDRAQRRSLMYDQVEACPISRAGSVPMTGRCARLPFVLAGVVAAMTAASASDSLVNSVAVANEIRTHGCDGRPGVMPLRLEPKLDAAAQRIAAGQSFEAALSASGFAARAATVLNFEVVSGIGAVQELLAGEFCKVITDPTFATLGIARRGSEIWIVLAAPLEFADTLDRAILNDRILDLTNRARARTQHCGTRKYPSAAPLSASAVLDQVARAHAEDMAARHLLTHAGHDGSSVRERVTRAGYASPAVAENIADGQPDAFIIVRDWLESPEQCMNLMDPQYSQMGVGYALSDEEGGRAYWAQVLAAPQR